MLIFNGGSVKYKDNYSLSLRVLYHGVGSLGADITLEERKAQELIRSRGYQLIKRGEEKGIISFLVAVPEEGKKALIWCLSIRETVGVRFLHQLKKSMEAEGAEGGIIIARSPYSYAAKTEAKNSGIELVPRIFPSFDIFEHALVPLHEVLTEEERKEVLAQYRVQPHQLPWIVVSDPAVKAIGGKPGDIVRITRESPTAGRYISYRYVIEG